VSIREDVELFQELVLNQGQPAQINQCVKS